LEPLLNARVRAAVGVVVVIGLGLLSRRPPIVAFLGKYPGDALYTVMVFYAVGFIRPDAPLARRALVALGFSYAIEVSQLYRPPWLVSIRATTLGHLVLGSDFQVNDLIAYTVGIAAAIGLEQGWKVLRRRAYDRGKS